MKYLVKSREVEAEQYLGPEEDPVWKERLLEAFPGIVVTRPHYCGLPSCGLPSCDARGQILVYLLDEQAQRVHPTEWIVKFEGQELSVVKDKDFRVRYEPTDPDQITGQRSFVFGMEN